MLTAKQVAEHLGISARAVYTVDSAALPRYRFGRSVRFDQADVDAYKAACRVAPPPRKRVELPMGSLHASLAGARRRIRSELEAYFREHGIKPRQAPGSRGRRSGDG